MTDRLFYTASEMGNLPSENAQLRAQLAEARAERDMYKAQAVKAHELEAFRKKIVALSSPKIKPDVMKALIVAEIEAQGKHQYEDGHVAIDHLATNKKFGDRVGVSDKTAGGTINVLKRAGLVSKTIERVQVNRYGQPLADPTRADETHGDHVMSQCHLTVKIIDDPDELQRRAEMASAIPTKKQLDAREQRAAERTTMKMVEKLRETPCPVCGVKGDLHIHCESCGWKDTDLPAKQEKAPRPKRAGRQRPMTDKQVRLAIAAGEHEAPDPLRIDQRPDEELTRRVKVHEALRALSGTPTTSQPPLDYRSYDDPGIEISGLLCRTNTDKKDKLSSESLTGGQVVPPLPFDGGNLGGQVVPPPLATSHNEVIG